MVLMREALKRIYFCSLGALVEVLCPYVNTIAERATKGGGAPSLMPWNGGTMEEQVTAWGSAG